MTRTQAPSSISIPSTKRGAAATTPFEADHPYRNEANMHTNRSIRVVLYTLMASVASGRAGAQSDSPRARSVTLVEVAFPARGRSAMIFHRRVGPDRDVIALGPNATSD